MVMMLLNYEGELRVRAQHQASGATLHTDAPLDNHGKGESFSPTDLVATALASCMATVMGIIAEREQIPLAGMRCTVKKIMSSQGPRRIAELQLEFYIPHNPSPEQKTKLENAALACPVAQSLHPDISYPVNFHWGVSI